MGSWFSTFLDLEFFLQATLGVSYRKNHNNQLDTIELLTAVRKIAARRKMSKKKSRNYASVSLAVNDMSSDDDTDFSSSEDGSSSEREREEQQLADRERRMAFRGRYTVGDEKSLAQLRLDIESRCGCDHPSTSVAMMTSMREIGLRNSRRRPVATQETLVNAFFPNSRKIVEKLSTTKSFCLQHIKGGSELVVASQDERIRFYKHDTSTSGHNHSDRYVGYKEISVMQCGWSILDVAVNAEGDGLCYGTWKDAIYYARLSEPTSENTEGVTWYQLDIPDSEHQMAVFAVRFSNDGRQVMGGASDYGIHIFDLETRVKKATIEHAHEDDVNTVCYAGDNSNLIFSGGDDGLVKVWDQRAWWEGDHNPVGVFAGHRDGVTFVDSRQDDRYLLSNCKDQTIKLWDLRKFSGPEGMAETRKSVSQQKWDYRWHPAPPGMCQPVAGDTSVITLRGHSVLHTLVRAKFSPNQTGKRYVYTGCAKGEVVVYDIVTGEVVHRLKGPLGVVRDVSWHPEKNEIAACSWDSTTSIWRWDERKSHPTAPTDNAKLGDEDSCDENYKPLECRQRRAQKIRRQCPPCPPRARPTLMRNPQTVSWDTDFEDDE